MPVRPPTPRVDDDDVETLSALTNPQLKLSAGDWLRERYRLTVPLGEGLFGATWRASDTAGGPDVAVKVMGTLLLLNEGERRDFHGKCEMFVRRTIAGCVFPSEVVTAPGCVAVISPFVDGVSLRAVIEARRSRGTPFSADESLRLVQSLVVALQAMHTASPHGLLRPENVLVTARGLLLADGVLGVCIPPDRLVERVRAAQPDAMPYVAPEVLAGRRPTASADLYALGAMATEIIGGATPDRGPQLTAFTPDVRRAIATLLDREPGRRPAGGRMLLDALSAMVGLAQRPADPPLPRPEQVAVRAAPTPVPTVTKDPPASVALPPAPSPAANFPPRPEHGRLGTATASLPLLPNPAAAVLAVMSGPPPEVSVRSGPPGGVPVAALPVQRISLPLPSVPSQPPPRMSAPRPARADAADADDGIDPRLLRAAKMLDAERRVPRSETPEEIELLDDD